MSKLEDQYTATWESGEYRCENTGWLSEDGSNWYYWNGDPVDDLRFDSAAITLIGGPVNQEPQS